MIEIKIFVLATIIVVVWSAIIWGAIKSKPYI